jgi:hypothetical protein
MHTHGPKCLPGPLTQERSWWSQPVPDTGKATPSSRRRKKARTMPEHQAKLPQDPEIRHELVERIRREIAAGTYETPEKWEAALRRLLEGLERE